MDKFKEFQESFIVHFQSLYKALKGKSNKELDEALVQQGESDEVKKLIAEQCIEIDLEHDLMEELWTSKEDPGKWLEKKIEQTAKEVDPNATQEEIDMLKEAVADSMEAEIGEQADGLAEEAAVIAGAVENEQPMKKE